MVKPILRQRSSAVPSSLFGIWKPAVTKVATRVLVATFIHVIFIFFFWLLLVAIFFFFFFFFFVLFFFGGGGGFFWWPFMLGVHTGDTSGHEKGITWGGSSWHGSALCAAVAQAVIRSLQPVQKGETQRQCCTA